MGLRTQIEKVALQYWPATAPTRQCSAAVGSRCTVPSGQSMRRPCRRSLDRCTARANLPPLVRPVAVLQRPAVDCRQLLGLLLRHRHPPRLGAWRGPPLDPCSGSQARCCRSQSEGTAADGEPLGPFARGGWIAAKVTARCRQRNARPGRLCGRRGWSGPGQDHALGAPSTGDFGPSASICCEVDPWRVPRTARWREQDPPTIYSWQTEDTRIAFCLEHWTSLCSKWMTT